MNDNRSPSQYQLYLTVASAVLSCCLGIVVIIGWYTKQATLIQVFPGFVPMQYNTALSFLLGGLGLIAAMRNLHKLTLFFGGSVLSIGMLTTYQYIASVDFGIDQLFVEHYILTKSYHPGRMAPNTALCFTLIGLCLTLTRCTFLNAALINALWRIGSLCVVALGLIAFIGYLSGIESAYGWGHLTRMAVHTSVGMVLLGMGLFISSIRQQIHTSSRADKWGAALFLGMVVVVVSLWQSLVDHSAIKVKYQVRSTSDAIGNGIEIHWRDQLAALQRMAQRWEASGNISQYAWENDARAYVEDLSGLQSLAWIDADNKVQWVSAIDAKQKISLAHLKLRSVAKTIEQAKASRHAPTFSSVYQDLQGKASFIVSIPLYVQGRYDGLILGAYQVGEFVSSSIDRRLHSGYDIQINIEDELVYSNLVSQDTSVTRQTSLLKENDWSHQHKLTTPASNWLLIVTPTPSLLSALHSSLPLWVLITGLTFSVGLTIILYFAQLTRKQAFVLEEEVLERKDIERSLKSTRDRLELAASVARMGIWEWDLKTDKLLWDEQMFSIYEVPNDTLPVYEHWRSRLHPEDVSETEKSLRQAISKGENWHYEFRIVLSDQSVRYIRANAACEFKDGKPIKLIGGNVDFTTEKELVLELQKTKIAAENANKAKSIFLANMSHEIRTPMNGVLGIIELLSRTDLSHQQRDYLNMVRGSATALLNILNDILDLSKIEAGKLEIESIPFDVREHIGEAVKCFSGNAHRKNLDLLMYIDPKVPHWLWGDPIRLKQILFNLTGNAVKFTSQGEVIVRADWISTPSPRLSISVSDTGIGIPEETQARIFSAFSQADSSTTRNFGGTGLGLSIVTQLVELMDGKLSLQSEMNKGATFSVDMPMSVFDNNEESVPIDVSAKLEALNICVVSHKNLDRQCLFDILHSWHCVITERKLMAELEQDISQNSCDYDLIVLDTRLPDFNIQRLHQSLEGQGEKSPFVILISRSADNSLTTIPPTMLASTRILVQPAKLSEIYSCLVDFFVTRDNAPKLQSSNTLETSQAKRILVAEDNEVNQTLIEGLLLDEEHSVEIVTNGEEAVEALKAGKYDMVFMDVQMPIMDGIEATRAIRLLESETAKHTPIIALTANAFKEDRENCSAAGMDDFLTKPLDPEALIKCIARWGNRQGGSAKLAS